MAIPDYGCKIPVRVEVLSGKNRALTSYFFCGNDSIDHYFQYEAAKDPAAVTYLVIDDSRNKLLAAMTIACSAIFLERKNQLTTLMSAIEVVYFAVDLQYQGLPYRPDDPYSLSHYLFSYLIERIRKIAKEHVGAAKIVLYSVPDARNFYRRLGFVPFGKYMYGDQGTYLSNCVPMYLDLIKN